MKKQVQKLAISSILFITSTALSAQALTEKTGLRFYEHHSSDMTGKALGQDANGSKSGYDFVSGNYYNSFKESTMGPYTNGENQNLDMVEHNGPFGTGNGASFLGFTSGISTIWAGDIKGNGTTKWMKAPANFDYANADDVKDISGVYNDAMAFQSVDAVKKDEVYIGRIRGGAQYVVIKCTATKLPVTQQGKDNIYFDFDYKTGTLATGLNEKNEMLFTMFPNPATDVLTFTLSTPALLASVKIYDAKGMEIVQDGVVNNNSIDVRTLANGLYFIRLTSADGNSSTKRFIKQ